MVASKCPVYLGTQIVHVSTGLVSHILDVWHEMMNTSLDTMSNSHSAFNPHLLVDFLWDESDTNSGILVQRTSQATPTNPWWPWSHLACHVSQSLGSQVVLVVKNLPAVQGHKRPAQSLGWEKIPWRRMATAYNVLVSESHGQRVSDRLQSWESLQVGHDEVTKHAHTVCLLSMSCWNSGLHE